MQDMSYKLGAAETRLAQIEAPKTDDDTARQSVPERDTENVEPVTAPTPAMTPSETAPAAPAETPVPHLSRADRFSADCSGREGERVIPAAPGSVRALVLQFPYGPARPTSMARRSDDADRVHP